jgi:hypothetical protein
MLNILETHYHSPVDTEFTARILDPSALHPEIQITLLQCRPQSHLKDNEVYLPKDIPPDDIVFSARRMVPRGRIDGIRFVVFVSPQGYFTLPTETARIEVGRAISRLNAVLSDEIFICVGPGRWGTRNPDLGVFVGYSDIYNTRALIELAGEEIGFSTEPSFGTHFFQDLVEADIFPLAIYLDDPDAVMNRKFFYETPNSLAEFLPAEDHLADCLRLIKVEAFRPNHHINLVMDDEQGQTLAYLSLDQE